MPRVRVRIALSVAVAVACAAWSVMVFTGVFLGSVAAVYRTLFAAIILLYGAFRLVMALSRKNSA